MLENIYILKIKLELLSGLFIGGSDNGFDIGGVDNDVVRNSLTKEPFIPGSSLKGKLKALLKYNLKETEIKDNDIVFTDDTITNIFKGLEDKDNNKVVISRAIFRDFELTDDSKEELQRILGINCFTESRKQSKSNFWNF